MKYFVTRTLAYPTGAESVSRFDINSDSQLTVAQVKTAAQEKSKDQNLINETVKIDGVEKDNGYKISAGELIEWSATLAKK